MKICKTDAYKSTINWAIWFLISFLFHHTFQPTFKKCPRDLTLYEKLHSNFIISIFVTMAIFNTLKIFLESKYSARRLIGSRIIESAAYCNQKLLAHLFLNSTQNTSVNWIIRLLLSLLCWPKVILLSGGHCSIHFKDIFALFFLRSSIDLGSRVFSSEVRLDFGET